MPSITVHYIVLLIKAIAELVTLDCYVCNLIEEETVSVPMEWLEIVVLHNLVATEHKAVERFCIDNWSIESLEYIVLNYNTLAITAVEIFCLRCKVGYFGIDGNNTVCKLEHTCESIDKAVVADNDIAASACLEPAVTVTAEQDCCTRCVVEEVILDKCLLWSAEESSTCTVVTDGIACKIDLGSPLKVLYTIVADNPEIPPSSRDEGLRLLHGLATNLATSLQTPQEA